LAHIGGDRVYLVGVQVDGDNLHPAGNERTEQPHSELPQTDYDDLFAHGLYPQVTTNSSSGRAQGSARSSGRARTRNTVMGPIRPASMQNMMMSFPTSSSRAVPPMESPTVPR